MNLCLAKPLSKIYTICLLADGISASFGISSLGLMFPKGIYKENLVPEALIFVGKSLFKLILSFLVPVLTFSMFTIPLTFPENLALLLKISTIEPILTSEAISDLKSVSISLNWVLRIDAKILPFDVNAPTCASILTMFPSIGDKILEKLL